MNLLISRWKYILPGIAAPILIMLLAERFSRKRSLEVAAANLRAFLIMIQYAEGTYGPNAYRMLYGGDLFTGYADHPAIAVTKAGITSTAAGAYQILHRTWSGLKETLQLSSFSPANQDKAAIELIRRRGALPDVLTGKFAAAVEKCQKEWASLPGAGYGQHERDINLLAAVYHSAGGQMVAYT